MKLPPTSSYLVLVYGLLFVTVREKEILTYRHKALFEKQLASSDCAFGLFRDYFPKHPVIFSVDDWDVQSAQSPPKSI